MLFVGVVVVVVVAVVTATLTNVSLIINAVFAVVARNLLPFVFSYIHSYILTYTDLHVNMYVLCSICAFVDGLRLLLLLRLIWHLTKNFCLETFPHLERHKPVATQTHINIIYKYTQKSALSYSPKLLRVILFLTNAGGELLCTPDRCNRSWSRSYVRQVRFHISYLRWLCASVEGPQIKIPQTERSKKKQTQEEMASRSSDAYRGHTKSCD